MSDHPDPLPTVASTSRHDSTSGHTMYYYAYWDEESESFECYTRCCCSEKPNTCEAPEEAQNLWSERKERRKRARSTISTIVDKFERPIECPVCESDSITSVSNKWVCRQVQNCHSDYDDPDPVYFCPDCEVNVWCSWGNFKGGLRIGTNAIDEGSDVSLNKDYSGWTSDPKNAKRSMMAGPEDAETRLAQFSIALQQLRNDLDVSEASGLPVEDDPIDGEAAELSG